ncbi:thiamine pyrophosphate-binding protein [Sorangium cellulosum]|uniref:thiamine pyrophosphate-binding protein n=1 Tax=Sorangium cellulosum TaxID=56 RepID=UPI0009B6C774|nr:thiamine pyrophosphate-binding protein [Sorangium cellulosum]
MPPTRNSQLLERVPPSGARAPAPGIGAVSAAPSSDRTGSQSLLDALLAAGVDTFFGVPGGPIIPLFDAILRSPRARLVESRQETHAAFAAVGYWRATGKVPAVVVTAGPGATNVVTGTVSAHLEGVPMLIICGDVAWEGSGARLLQSMGREGVGIEEMLRNVTRAMVRVTSARAAASQAMAALRAARNPGHPGPSLIVLPMNHGVATTGPAQIAWNPVSTAEHVEESVIIDAAERLARARRPLVVIGAACRPHAEAVERMVEALNIPFMTTPQAKGILSEEHPLSLRNAGMAASWWARRYTAGGVDTALVLGTDLDDCSIGPTHPIGPGGVLIHVDTDARVFNRNIPTELMIAGDLATFARQLHDVAKRLNLRSLNAAAPLAEAKRCSPFDAEGFREDASPRVAPHRVIADLERAAPGATFITDIGEHMLFALHYLTARGPDRFLIHLGLGSMASGICSAIGYALGDRSREVVCICGDGGMQMAGSELLVAIKLGLRIVYAVFNDARYNMVYHGYRQLFGRNASWDTPCIDLVAWARSFGATAALIERPGEITAELLDRLTARGVPVVLDIRHDADIRIQGAGRVEALQQMSSLSSPA